MLDPEHAVLAGSALPVLDVAISSPERAVNDEL